MTHIPIYTPTHLALLSKLHQISIFKFFSTQNFSQRRPRTQGRYNTNRSIFEFVLTYQIVFLSNVHLI